MNYHISKRKNNHMAKLRSVCILTLIVSFVGSSLYIPQSYAQALVLPSMPKPGIMVHLSPEFTPACLRGIVVHPENGLKFDFIVYKGDKVLTEDQKKVEYTKLAKYFLASLAVPDDDQWVNLSPYEKDRIIKDDFGKTEMGRDLLAQDYILKQITASLIYPESNLGKKFWDKVYTEAQQQFGSTTIPVNTFNKVWIVPESADIYENGNTAFVYKSRLKVLMEEDYLSLQKHTGIQSVPMDNRAQTVASKIVKEIVLPALEKEVNEGKNFANLRQVYSGMVLAAWYKRALKESLLSRIYANKAKVKGVDQDPRTNEMIYKQYLKAYKRGVFNYIKEDVDKYTNETIPRKYFSGGFAMTSAAMTAIEHRHPGTDRVARGEASGVFGTGTKYEEAIGLDVEQREKGIIRAALARTAQAAPAMMTPKQRANAIDRMFRRAGYGTRIKTTLPNKEFILASRVNPTNNGLIQITDLGNVTITIESIRISEVGGQQVTNQAMLTPAQFEQEYSTNVVNKLDTVSQLALKLADLNKDINEALDEQGGPGGLLEGQREAGSFLDINARHQIERVDKLLLRQGTSRALSGDLIDARITIVNIARHTATFIRQKQRQRVESARAGINRKPQITGKLQELLIRNDQTRFITSMAEMGFITSRGNNIIDVNTGKRAAFGELLNRIVFDPKVLIDYQIKSIDPNFFRRSILKILSEKGGVKEVPYGIYTLTYVNVPVTEGEPTEVAVVLRIGRLVLASGVVNNETFKQMKDGLDGEFQESVLGVRITAAVVSQAIKLRGLKNKGRAVETIRQAEIRLVGDQQLRARIMTDLFNDLIRRDQELKGYQDTLGLTTNPANRFLSDMEARVGRPLRELRSTLNAIEPTNLSTAEIQKRRKFAQTQLDQIQREFNILEASVGPASEAMASPARVRRARRMSPRLSRILKISIPVAALILLNMWQGSKKNPTGLPSGVITPPSFLPTTVPAVQELTFEHTITQTVGKRTAVLTYKKELVTVRIDSGKEEVYPYPKVILSKDDKTLSWEGTLDNLGYGSKDNYAILMLLERKLPPNSPIKEVVHDSLTSMNPGHLDTPDYLKPGDPMNDFFLLVKKGEGTVKVEADKITVTVPAPGPATQPASQPSTLPAATQPSVNRGNKEGSEAVRLAATATLDKLYGGIDFNSANLTLRIKRNGKGVPLPWSQQDMAQLNQIDGLTPVLLDIEPATASPFMANLSQAATP